MWGGPSTPPYWMISIEGGLLLAIEMNWSCKITPDSKVHRSNIGPNWVLSAPDGPHVDPWSLLSGIIRLIEQQIFSRHRELFNFPLFPDHRAAACQWPRVQPQDMHDGVIRNLFCYVLNNFDHYKTSGPYRVINYDLSRRINEAPNNEVFKRYHLTHRSFNKNYKRNFPTERLHLNVDVPFIINTIRPREIPPCCRRHFKIYFLEWKPLYFLLKFCENYSQGSS